MLTIVETCDVCGLRDESPKVEFSPLTRSLLLAWLYKQSTEGSKCYVCRGEEPTAIEMEGVARATANRQ